MLTAMSILRQSTGVDRDDLDPSQTDVSLKCRRIGGTTYYIADYLADAIVEGNHYIRFVAHDPDTIDSFLDTLKFMYEHLRPEIKPRHKYNSKTELEFADEDKKVFSKFTISTVTPGKEDKGRGQTITRLHLTEIPFWPGDRKKAYTALKDAAKGGKVTEESTAGGVGDEFHADYQKGKSGQAGYRSHFFAWWWNRNYQIHGYRFEQHEEQWYLLEARQSFARLSDDDRDAARISTYNEEERYKHDFLLQSEKDCAQAVLSHLKIKGYVSSEAEWNCEAVAAFIAWRRHEIEEKGERDFRREYPENDVDPFTQAGGMVFGYRYLVLRAKFRDPLPGEECKVMLDPCDGVEGGHPFYISVISCHTGEQLWGEHGVRKQDWQALRCVELSDKYNGAEIGIERNKGEAAILEVERLGRGHRLYREIDAELERDIAENKITFQDAWEKAKPGINLTDRKKRLYINSFEKAWRTGDYKCADQYVIDEAMVFIQDGEAFHAKSGYNDDSILSSCECWYLVEHSRTGPAGYISSGEKLSSAMISAY